jgi:hypothetical protein
MIGCSVSVERFCPICQKTSLFSPFGVNPRQDACCPHCFSLERHRLLYLFLKEKIDFFAKNRREMLHVAPESCFEDLFEKTINGGGGDILQQIFITLMLW